MKVWKCDICGKVEPRSIRRIVAFNPDVNDSPLNSEEIYGFNLFYGEFCEDCLYKIERSISKEIDKLKRENDEKKQEKMKEIYNYEVKK